MRKVQNAWELGDMPAFVDLLAKLRPDRTGGTDFRGFEWYYWMKRMQGKIHTFGDSNDHGAGSVCFSPDGKKFAGCLGRDVKIWDIVSQKELLTFEGENRPHNYWNLR